ncbi:MAG: hypothetical protein V1720_18725 [bacterium]
MEMIYRIRTLSKIDLDRFRLFGSKGEDENAQTRIIEGTIEEIKETLKKNSAKFVGRHSFIFNFLRYHELVLTEQINHALLMEYDQKEKTVLYLYESEDEDGITKWIFH